MNWSVSLVSGTLARRNASPAEAHEVLSISEPEVIDVAAISVGPYLDRAIQGATLAPRPFWFIAPVAPARGRSLLVKTDPKQARRAKEPWKGIQLEGEIEMEFLYATNLEVAPYRLGPMKLLALPVKVSDGRIALMSPTEVLRAGGAGLHRWLAEGDEIWKARRKESVAQDVELFEYLDNHNNLTRQRLSGGVKLVYGGKGTHVRAVVVDVASTVTAFAAEIGTTINGLVFDMNLYYVSCRTSDEAHYLAAIMNTPYVDDGIKATQTQGAWGARDIHRRPFEMFPIPEFDPKNEDHRRLAEISRSAHDVLATRAASSRYWLQLEPVMGLVEEAHVLAQKICERR